MRAFHCSWMGFFTAFFIWFAIAPLLPEIKETLKLTKQEVWTSNICSVAGTIFMRFINGPMWWVYHIITMHQTLHLFYTNMSLIIYLPFLYLTVTSMVLVFWWEFFSWQLPSHVHALDSSTVLPPFPSFVSSLDLVDLPSFAANSGHHVCLPRRLPALPTPSSVAGET